MVSNCGVVQIQPITESLETREKFRFTIGENHLLVTTVQHILSTTARDTVISALEVKETPLSYYGNLLSD